MCQACRRHRIRARNEVRKPSPGASRALGTHSRHLQCFVSKATWTLISADTSKRGASSLDNITSAPTSPPICTAVPRVGAPVTAPTVCDVRFRACVSGARGGGTCAARWSSSPGELPRARRNPPNRRCRGPLHVRLASPRTPRRASREKPGVQAR